MRRVIVLVVFVWMCACGIAQAVTLMVGPGEEYSTIQAAIADASDGDVVQVQPGEYVENIVLKEGVDVIGAGADETVIRSLSESFPSATVDGKDNVTLSGFTITGGYYGIRCSGTSPTITDCVIWRNAYCGVLLESSSVTVTRCVIAQNPRYGVQCLDSSAPTISNCTFSANGYGVFSSDSDPVLSNCILWDNWDDLEGISDGTSVSYCNIHDADFAGENGNLSVNPAFVAWGSFNDSDNQLYVDVAHVGQQEGTRDNPLSRIKSALSVYSYRLGIGSPCLNAGEGNVHMGAYPDEDPTASPGSDKVLVNVAPGTYYESRLFLCHGAEVRGSPGPPSRIVAFGDTGFYMLGQSSVENFIIAGGDDAIACFFSEATIRDCYILECGQNGIYSFNGNPSIRRCHMLYNFGAGIMIEGGNGAISDCFISSQGSAGISCDGGCAATIRNCLLTQNPVGVSCGWISDVEVHNSTIATNGWRGGESRQGASLKIVNSIVWGNAFGELIEEGGSVEARFSNVGGGFPGEGNLSGNPLFEAGPLGSFYLDSDSPCVDKGSDPAENLGLDHKTTSLTSDPDSGIVDMGYHYERFEIRRITSRDGQVTLEWSSSPNLDYMIFRASDLSSPSPWQLLGNVAATWLQETYSFDEPAASTEFYCISRP